MCQQSALDHPENMQTHILHEDTRAEDVCEDKCERRF